jgi:hypothetical protein
VCVSVCVENDGMSCKKQIKLNHCINLSFLWDDFDLLQSLLERVFFSFLLLSDSIIHNPLSITKILKYMIFSSAPEHGHMPIRRSVSNHLLQNNFDYDRLSKNVLPEYFFLLYIHIYRLRMSGIESERVREWN